MATNFPDSLDVFTDQTAADLITSAKWNNMQDAIEACEAKLGVDSSAVTSSLDYLVKSTSSLNPGHKHTLANSATDVAATKDEVNTLASSGITNADLIKVHALTPSAAEINVIKDSGVTNADLVKLHGVTSSAETLNAVVTTARTITAGTGLSGGGTLAADRTITHAPHTGDVTGATALTIANNAVTTAKIADGNVTAPKMAAYTAGDYIEAVSPGTKTTTSTSYTKLKEFYVPRAGTIRLRWTAIDSTPSIGASMATRSYVNGSAYGSAKGGGGAQYDDISVSAGDLVQIYGYVAGGDGVTDTAGVSKACICCAVPITAGCNYNYYDA